jgi:hypothetical protein
MKQFIMKRLILFSLAFLFLVFLIYKNYAPAPTKVDTISIQKIPDVARDDNGKIKRSKSAVHIFLKEHGLTKIPKGYQVDHIIPLWKGGSDTPDNMQLLTLEEHHKKTAQEAHERAKLKRK